MSSLHHDPAGARSAATITVGSDPTGPPPQGPSVVFLHSPAHPHASHVALAHRLGASRWEAFAPQGRRRLPTALRTARRLARDPGWDSLFAEGPCLEGLFLRLLDRRQRPLVRLDSQNSSLQLRDEPLPVRVVRRGEFRAWDALVTIGTAGTAATRRLVRPGTPVVPWVPSATIGDPFGAVVADQGGPAVAVLTGGARHRAGYKGLDRVAAVAAAALADGWAPVTVFGAWDEATMAPLRTSLRFAGHQPTVTALSGASMLVHLPRHDAFPVAVVEAMLAGVPPVVGEAGSAVLVDAVEPRLHVADEAAALDAMRWLRALPASEYRDLGERLRREALRFVAGEPGAAAVPDIMAVLGRRGGRR